MHVIVWLHESKQSILRLALPHQSPKLARHEQFDLHLEVHRCWGLSAPFQWHFPVTGWSNNVSWSYQRLASRWSGKLCLCDIKAFKAVYLKLIPWDLESNGPSKHLVLRNLRYFSSVFFQMHFIFVWRIFKYVKTQLPKKMRNLIGYICAIIFHFKFLNVSSNWMFTSGKWGHGCAC